MKKLRPTSSKDTFLEMLKKATKEIVEDPQASRRDRNVAISNGAKLLQIEHKISPGDEGDFWG